MAILTAKLKRFFFDRLAIENRVDADRMRFLRHAGGYTRRVARNSMKTKGVARKAPKNRDSKAYARWELEALQQPPSPAGTPPNVHSADPVRTLKNILFGYDDTSESMVIGPQHLQAKRRQGERPVPALHEHGGNKLIIEKMVSFSDRVVVGEQGRGADGRFRKPKREVIKGRRWVPLNGRAQPGQPVRQRMATYPKRPFMAPAGAKTKLKFPQLWFNEVY